MLSGFILTGCGSSTLDEAGGYEGLMACSSFRISAVAEDRNVALSSMADAEEYAWQAADKNEKYRGLSTGLIKIKAGLEDNLPHLIESGFVEVAKTCDTLFPLN